MLAEASVPRDANHAFQVPDSWFLVPLFRFSRLPATILTAGRLGMKMRSQALFFAKERRSGETAA